MKHSSEFKRQRYRNFDTSIVGERVCEYLRRLHPARTVDNVAADLAAWDVKPATIAKMLERRTAPGTIMWLALIHAYGPDFLSAVHPAQLGWLSAASRDQKREALELAMAKLKAELDGLE